MPPKIPAPRHPPIPASALPWQPPPEQTALRLGVAAMILGAVSVVFTWTSFCGVGVFPFAGLGLALGLAGLTLSLRSRGQQRLLMPAIGSSLCTLALFVGLIAIIMREESPEVNQERNARYAKEQKAREAMAAAQRPQGSLDFSWTARPADLPPFTVISDRYEDDGFKSAGYRNAELQASGDLTEANLGRILDYAAQQHKIYSTNITLRAADPRPGGGNITLATRSPNGNSIDTSALAIYQTARAASRPSTGPTTSPARRE